MKRKQGTTYELVEGKAPAPAPGVATGTDTAPGVRVFRCFVEPWMTRNKWGPGEAPFCPLCGYRMVEELTP